MDDPLRGTGRTTGLMLKAIGEALLSRCTWVEVADHYPRDPTLLLDTIELLCAQLGLQFMRTRIRGERVYVISLAPVKATPESAPQYPECPPLP